MPYNYREFEKKLSIIGFKKVRQKGSHVLFSNGIITFPVPNHGGKDISIGVEKKILKLIKFSSEDFRNV